MYVCVCGWMGIDTNCVYAYEIKITRKMNARKWMNGKSFAARAITKPSQVKERKQKHFCIRRWWWICWLATFSIINHSWTSPATSNYYHECKQFPTKLISNNLNMLLFYSFIYVHSKAFTSFPPLNPPTSRLLICFRCFSSSFLAGELYGYNFCCSAMASKFFHWFH